MSIYAYPESKIIDQVTFRKTEGGHHYAYVQAAAGADPAVLADIVKQCSQKGWQCTPYTLDGKAVLQVQGARNPAQITQFLSEKNWIQGEAKFTKVDEEKLGFKEQLKKRSLGASGAFYVIGDAAFTNYGYRGANELNIAAGVLYGAGTVSLLSGGRKDQSDLQIRELSKKMSQYLKENGEKLPNSCSIDSINEDHKKGLLKSADDLIRRYPSELMNLFYAAAGVCIGIAAAKSLHKPITDKEFQKEVSEIFKLKTKPITKQFPSAKLAFSDLKRARTELAQKMYKNHKLENTLDIGLGSMTTLSGLFAMAVKEKKPDPDAPEKHGLEALWQKIQEKPLAVAGIGYMVSTMCHAVSTGLAWQYAGKEKRKTIFSRGVFVGANIIAEILLAISSKGHGEGVKSDKTVDNTMIALAADLVVKQPKHMQEELITNVSHFLGRPDVLALKNGEAEKLLREQVETMRKNPWAMCGEKAAPQVPDALSELSVNEKAIVPGKSSAAAWQAKVAAGKNTPLEPSLST